MVEVVVTLRFITPCLGGKRAKEPGQPDTMSRDRDGHVIFQQNWWNALLSYGAQAFSKHQGRVCGIRWDPVVDGTTEIFNRYWASTEFTPHESFLADAEIGVRAMLPKKFPIGDFKKILEIGGKYKGISPYGYDDGYGRFEVVEVRRVR